MLKPLRYTGRAEIHKKQNGGSVNMSVLKLANAGIQ